MNIENEEYIKIEHFKKEISGLKELCEKLGDIFIEYSRKVNFNIYSQRKGAELIHNVGQKLIFELEEKEKEK